MSPHLSQSLPMRRSSSDSTVANRLGGVEADITIIEKHSDSETPDQNPLSSSSSNYGQDGSTSKDDDAPAEQDQKEDHDPQQQQDQQDQQDQQQQQESQPPAEPEASRTKLETFLVMFALCLTLFLAALDMTIITTAIPTISNHFHSSAGYVWIGSAYQLGSAAFVPAWGKLSDIFGRKPALLGAVVIFWIGSLICALSNSMGMLIAARAIQGVGGGGAMALPNICVSDLFSMRKRGLYFGVLGVVWAVAGAIGPILGGVFASKVSWRWCFYINLPTSGLAMAILIFVLKLHNPRTPMRQGLAAIDWAGNVLVIGGTLLLLLGLEFGGVTFPWKSATVICLIVFGVVTLALFGIWENLVARYPVMPARLFNTVTNAAAYTACILHAMVFMSGSYWLPLYYQAVLGATSLLSGVYLLPWVLGLSCTSAVIGVIIKKTGLYKPPVVFGFTVMTLGVGLFISLGPKANWAKMIIFQIIAGIGVGPNFQSPLLAIQNNVEPRDIGSATSTYQFIRQIGTAASVVIGGVIFDNVMQSQQGKLAQELGSELADHFSGTNAASSVFLVRTLKGHALQIVREAYWKSLQRMYIVFTCIGFLGLLIVLLIKPKNLSSDHKEHKTGLQSLKAEKRKTKDSETAAAEDKS